MNKEDKEFINKYEELLNQGYCNCNELNCLDNDVPKKLLGLIQRLDSTIEDLKKENVELHVCENITIDFLWILRKIKDYEKDVYSKYE